MRSTEISKEGSFGKAGWGSWRSRSRIWRWDLHTATSTVQLFTSTSPSCQRIMEISNRCNPPKQKQCKCHVLTLLSNSDVLIHLFKSNHPTKSMIWQMWHQWWPLIKGNDKIIWRKLLIWTSFSWKYVKLLWNNSGEKAHFIRLTWDLQPFGHFLLFFDYFFIIICFWLFLYINLFSLSSRWL